jgi:hypothetical protein
MISKAIKCDKCERTEFLTREQYDVCTAEGASDGWIRMFTNNPKKASYDTTQVTSTEWLDLCSISCALMSLYGME